MNGEKCAITISADDSTATLADLVTAEAAKAAPLFAWAEPDVMAAVIDNRTGRRPDFRPFVRGKPDWPADLPLVEARLFWETAALHVVALDTGCRWARLEEGGNLEAIRRAFPVHTLKDGRRFGMTGDEGDIGGLTAVEYWREGRLIGWRLTKAGA